MTGFIVVGSLYALPAGAGLKGWNPAFFLLASYLVTVSIYAFNSWAGFSEDHANPRQRTSAGLSRARFAGIAAAAFFLSLAIFSRVRPGALPWVFAVFLFSTAYSFPNHGFKYIPVAGTAAHVAIAIAQFQLGWSLFKNVGAASLLLSAYFGVVFSAGHVNHELIDLDADRKAGIMSGAVRFGPQIWTRLHLVLAVFGLMVLGSLWLLDQPDFPRSLILPFLGASCAHSVAAGILQFGTHSQDVYLRHRTRYRLIYFSAGMAVVALSRFHILG
jgi:4-hydroxybenzoate polyprenyltransferase